MLSLLHIENIAIIESADISFDGGFNVLTGETGDPGPDLPALESAFRERFYALELRDQTRPAQSLWARAGEDSLRGLFLQELRSRYDAAATAEEQAQIVQAVRFGLAALDGRDMG